MQHFHFVAFEGRSSWSSRAATCPCFSGTQHLLCELSVLDAMHLQKFHMPGGCSLPHESQKFSLERAAPVDLDVSMASSLLTAWLFDVLCGFSNLKLFLAHSQRVQPSCVPSHLTSFNCELT